MTTRRQRRRERFLRQAETLWGRIGLGLLGMGGLLAAAFGVLLLAGARDSMDWTVAMVWISVPLVALFAGCVYSRDVALGAAGIVWVVCEAWVAIISVAAALLGLLSV